MFAFVVTLHVFVCVLLILIVLLQTGKGAEIGAVLGGSGSQTLFGSTGATTFLSKLTTVIAIVFMLTSLVLAYMSGHRHSDSIMLNTPAPVEQKTPADQPQATAPLQSGTQNGAQPGTPAKATDAAQSPMAETTPPENHEAAVPANEIPMDEKPSDGSQ